MAITRQLDESTLAEWLWDAACQIRGPVDAPKFKDYILPLVFIKRLSDVFEDEITYLAGEFDSRDLAAELVDDDHGLVRYFVPHSTRWRVNTQSTSGVWEQLIAAIHDLSR